MKLSVPRLDLLSALKLAKGVASTKSTIPMLQHVLLRTVQGRLLICATDLCVSVTAELIASVVDTGDMAVNAGNLHDLVANAPGEEISLTTTPNGFADVKSGKAKYKLAALPGRDFPKMPDTSKADWVSIESEVLATLIERTVYACSRDTNRYQMCGVLITSNTTRLTMTSTDGHRCTRMSMLAPGIKTSPVILPTDGAKAVLALAGQGPGCKLAVAAGYLHVQQDGVTVSVKLIDGVYPPIDQVIPSRDGKILVVDRLALLGALKRASLMTKETIPVKMRLTKDTVEISVVNADMGQVSDEIEASYSSPEMEIGFKHQYLAEWLQACPSDSIRCSLGGELDPFLVESNDGYLGVIMPMRI